MIESYAVGAIFRIVDESSSTLAAIERRLGQIDALAKSTQRSLSEMAAVRLTTLNRSLLTMGDRLATVGARSEELRGVFAQSMESVNAGLLSATRTARELAAAIGEISIASRAMARASVLPGAGGGRGGGGRRSVLGGHLAGSVPLGPVHGRVTGGVGLGIAAAVGYGAYEEAEIESAVARSLFTAGTPVSPTMMQTPQAAQMRALIMAGMRETGRGPKDISEATMSLFRQMGGMPLESRIAAMPEVFRFAGLESRLKGSSMDEASEALVGMLHLTGAYTPDQMSHYTAQLSYASLLSPLPLKSMERAATYVIPSAITAGLDPGALLQVLSTAQSAGLINTRSGTAWDALLRTLSPKTGLPSLVSGTGADKRRAGLIKLGLMEPNGRLSAIENLEKTNDWAALATTVREHLDKVPEAQRLGLIGQALGSTQAARALNMLIQPSFTQRLPQLMEQSRQYLSHGAEYGLNQLADADPMLNVLRNLLELNDDLIQLGSVALPPIVSLFTSLANVSKEINGIFTGAAGGNVTISDAARIGLITGIVGFWFGGPLGAAVGALLGAGTTLAIKGATDPDFFGIKPGTNPNLKPNPAGGGSLWNFGFAPPPALPPATPAGPSAAPPLNLPGAPHLIPGVHHSSLDGFNFSGTVVIQTASNDPGAHADAFLAAVARKVAQSHTRNQGEGDSIYSSPFLAGANA